MPYIVNKNTFEKRSEELIGHLFDTHETKGPLTNIYLDDDDYISLEFAIGDVLKEKEFVLTKYHPDLIPYLSLLGKNFKAVMPYENDEDWTIVGVDTEMESCVGKFYICTKIQMVEGVPAIYLNNGYWYPVSCYIDKNVNPKMFIGMYRIGHDHKGWIKECYTIGTTIMYKTMDDQWYSENLDLSLFTRNEPKWLTAGSYVVLLRACSEENPWEPSMPTNYVYRLKETAGMFNFMIDLDDQLSTTNGWNLSIGHEQNDKLNKLKLRPATDKEIMYYKMAERPIPINPTEQIGIIEEKKEPEEEIIKTKRLSSKNYL